MWVWGGEGEVGLGTRSIRSFWVKDTSTVAAARNVSPHWSGADLGGGRRGGAPPPSPPEMTCGFLIQLVFCRKKNYVVYWC